MSGFRLVVALTLFVMIAFAANLPTTTHGDRLITMWLQRAAPAADVPAAALAFVGALEVIPTLAAAGLVLVLLEGKRHGHALLWLAFGVVAVSLVTVILQKAIVDPGPPLTLLRPIAQQGVSSFADPKVIIGLAAFGLVLLFLRSNRDGRTFLWIGAGAVGVGVVTIILQDVIVRLGQQFLDVIGLSSTYAFPSGHMTRTTFLAGTAFRRIPALVVAMVIGMAVSLVYLGVHSISEVLGGFCLGWACVEVAWQVWRWLG